MIQQEGLMTLPELRAGDVARVIEIRSGEGSAGDGRLLKLSSLGLVPGSLVRFQQRWPACVVWVGETQLSLDEEVARHIWLEKITS